MAKKAKSDFNMSEEIRNQLKENRTLTGSEVLAALGEKFPGESINKNSFGVAFYSARKKLGIKISKRRTGGVKKTVVQKRPVAAATADIGTLTAAAKFVSVVGDADTAIAAIKQLSSLQIK